MLSVSPEALKAFTEDSEQLTLENQKAYPKGYCCTRCFEAETDVKRCQCRCKGQFHGIAHKRDMTLADKTPLDQTSK